MKTLLKVLDKDMCPPIQGGKPYRKHKWYFCKNYDTSDTECAPGYYGIPVSELIHYHRPSQGTRVFECRFDGKSKCFSADKQRYEKMIIDRELSKDEIIAICKDAEGTIGYKLAEALYPINPLLLPKRIPTEDDLVLLKEWRSVRRSVRGSVRDSVRDSVAGSVRDSVWDSVRGSVRDSVWDSVWDSVARSVWGSVYSYFGSLFPNIADWKYVDHEPGKYPFESGAELWRRGLVSSFDGITWRLLSGKNMDIVWEA